MSWIQSFRFVKNCNQITVTFTSRGSQCSMIFFISNQRTNILEYLIVIITTWNQFNVCERVKETSMFDLLWWFTQVWLKQHLGKNPKGHVTMWLDVWSEEVMETQNSLIYLHFDTRLTWFPIVIVWSQNLHDFMISWKRRNIYRFADFLPLIWVGSLAPSCSGSTWWAGLTPGSPPSWACPEFNMEEQLFYFLCLSSSP